MEPPVLGIVGTATAVAIVGWGVGLSAMADREQAAIRIGPLWHLLLAGIVAVPTAVALLAGSSPRWGVLGPAAALAAWHWAFLVRGRSRAVRPVPMAVYWVGTTVLLTLLAGNDPTFVVVLYGCYPLAFVTLGWWGMAPVLTLTALVSWRVGAFEHGSGWVNVLATASLALVITAVIRTVERQSEERRAALVALGATRAELAETARRAGVLEERQRLARELHDTVAQGLTSIVTHLEAADQALPPGPGTTRTHLATARRAARDGLGEIRRTVRALRPDLLDGASLPEALRRTAALLTVDHGVPTQVRVTGVPIELHPDTETALLRIAQESLTNVARHARAGRAVVTLSYVGDAVTLDIDDDGTGFDPGRGRTSTSSARPPTGWPHSIRCASSYRTSC